MSKKNSNTNNTANSKAKKAGNKRPVLKVTVIPAEGRFSFESRKKITSQKVFDMCFSAASIISSIAGSDNPAEGEEMAAEFGFSLMTSMLSSFATVIDTQGGQGSHRICMQAGWQGCIVSQAILHFILQRAGA